MAHFAKLNDYDIVDQVIVVSNEELQNLPFPESEPLGIAFLTEWSGGYKNWKQTSYNGNFRKHFAGHGYFYDKYRDAFIPSRPEQYLSWVLDQEKLLWVPPIPYPNDPDLNVRYKWDETTISFVKIQLPTI